MDRRKLLRRNEGRPCNNRSISDLCAEGTAEKIEEAKEKMASGEWDVFDGVIECNDGTTVGEEGKSMPDSDITGNMNWYYKNVVEK